MIETIDEDEDIPEIFWPESITPDQQRLIFDAAQWSRLAYTIQPVPDVNNSLEFLNSKISNLQTVDCPETDAFCLVFDVVDKNVLVVSTRGSTTPEDFLCDLKLLQIEFGPENAMVHRGFHSQYEDLKSSINTRVMAHLQRGGELICTGHSLGAAVSAILSLSYALKFPKRVSFIGLGTPRPGNSVFASLMHEYLTFAVCIKNKRDPVCALLPSLWYARACQEVCIGHDHFPLVPDPLFVFDHNISDYVTNLRSKKTNL